MHLLSDNLHEQSTSLKKKESSKDKIDTEEALAKPNLELTDELEFFQAGVFAHLDAIYPSLYIDESSFVNSTFDF